MLPYLAVDIGQDDSVFLTQPGEDGEGAYGLAKCYQGRCVDTLQRIGDFWRFLKATV